MELLVFILIAGGIIYSVTYTGNRWKTRQRELYEAYQKALASGNKGHASLTGRIYYSYLRKGMPTPADEESIFNDIIEMKSDSAEGTTPNHITCENYQQEIINAQ